MKPDNAIVQWALLLSLTLAAACGVVNAERLPIGSLSGKVVGPEGRPISGAAVFLDNFDEDAGNSKPVARTATSSDGTFQLASLTPEFRHWEMASNDLRVEAPGFAPQVVPRGTFSIFPGTDTAVGTIRLDRGQVITGQVLDTDGQPRVGAIVECQSRRYVTAAFSSPMTPQFKLLTDSQGRFVTPPLPVSFTGFTVRAPGRQMPWVRVAVSPEARVEIPPIRLQPSNKVVATVTDDSGEPVAGATVYASGWDFGPCWLMSQQLVSDSRGQFILDGIGRKIQLYVSADNHVAIDWVLRCGADGIRWHDVHGWTGDAKALNPPTDALHITLKSVAFIEGRATDADTGQPVRLKQIVRCDFDRKPGGEIVLNGCHSADFSQDADGQFRLPYEFPDEYHLTLSAAGYQDAEAFTPKVKTLQHIGGIMVKLHKRTDAAGPQLARQTLFGTVTRDGRAVKTGWVSFSYPHRKPDMLNVAIFRGRTVSTHDNVGTSVPIRDGRYLLPIPYQRNDWLIEEEEPGQPVMQIVAVSVGLNERKTLDITAAHGGSVAGHVAGIPTIWSHDTFVVAFNNDGLHFETPVAADGAFKFDQLPPGEFGLKAGHDAFMDAERAPEMVADDDKSYSALADPWKRATVVQVHADQSATDVRLQLPEH